MPQNRLTWPALLEHPFVKETAEELEARVMISRFFYIFEKRNVEMIETALLMKLK